MISLPTSLAVPTVKRSSSAPVEKRAKVCVAVLKPLAMTLNITSLPRAAT